MTPEVSWFIGAARCPSALPTGEFGPWAIERVAISDQDPNRERVGFPSMTVLSRHTMATLHLPRGETVMEDSRRELQKHLPIWLRSRGRVLVTGLGLGCVVRGLLANPEVERITVVEIDGNIIRAVWGEFRETERCMLLQGDAFDLQWPPGTRWDYAWHDIWHEGTHEAVLHSKLMLRYQSMCSWQGAWGMPRFWRRRVGGDFIKGT